MKTFQFTDSEMRILSAAVIEYYRSANWASQHHKLDEQREIAKTHADFCMEVWTAIATHMAEQQTKEKTQ